MRVFNTRAYTKWLHRHYEDHFDVDGLRLSIPGQSLRKLHKDFYILEIPPGKQRDMYAYCTVGMSADRLDDNLIELFVYSPMQSESLVELMSWCASWHRNRFPLKTNHTVNIGQPWLHSSQCDHGLISLPYLEGKKLQYFRFEDHTIDCQWFIPITELEREYRVRYGQKALEKLFIKKQFNYLDPGRKCLVTGE